MGKWDISGRLGVDQDQNAGGVRGEGSKREDYLDSGLKTQDFFTFQGCGVRWGKTSSARQGKMGVFQNPVKL